tara:strand:- start:2701 stop:3321 length:621 start_codon:yes stop_codon:yes gene_type:complete
MADENDEKTFTQADLDAAVAKAVEALKAKNDELLGETKAERKKRQELEAAQETAEAERQKKAGEFRELYEKTQAELEKERAQAAAFKATIREKDIEGTAGAIASELTRDTARAALLRKEAAALLKHTDEGVQYEIGGVQVDRAKVLDHLKAAYPFLADGNQSNGGGAGGGSGGAGSITKEQFKAMGDKERIELHRNDPETFRRLAG